MCHYKEKISKNSSKDSSQSNSDSVMQAVLQMYQMAHNELLVRIQQRDQYYICIIGAFIAILVGAFSSQYTQSNYIGFAVFCGIGLGLMMFLTFLWWNSCSIYKELVEHIVTLEQVIAGNDDGYLSNNLQMWQHRIDMVLQGHRAKSFDFATKIFMALNLIALAVFIWILWKCGLW